MWSACSLADWEASVLWGWRQRRTVSPLGCAVHMGAATHSRPWPWAPLRISASSTLIHSWGLKTPGTSLPFPAASSGSHSPWPPAGVLGGPGCCLLPLLPTPRGIPPLHTKAPTLSLNNNPPIPTPTPHSLPPAPHAGSQKVGYPVERASRWEAGPLTRP